jgi:hypothetical protein
MNRLQEVKTSAVGSDPAALGVLFQSREAGIPNHCAAENQSLLWFNSSDLYGKINIRQVRK